MRIIILLSLLLLSACGRSPSLNTSTQQNSRGCGMSDGYYVCLQK